LSERSLTFSFTNIRGAWSNLLPTQHYLLLKCPAVMALCETFLTITSATPEYPGYDVIRSDRQHSQPGKRIHGGGLLVLIRQDLPHKIVSKSSTADFETITVSLTLGERSLIVTFAYRPPTASTQIFDHLIHHHQQLQQNFPNAERIIMGDFNCHNSMWLNSNTTDQCGVEAENLAAHLNMQQLVTDPTRFSANLLTSNILDLLYVNDPALHYATTSPPLGSSDHSVISSTMTWCSGRKPAPSQPRLAYNYEKADWTQMKKHFRRINWKMLLVPHKTSESAVAFENTIKQAMLTYIPHRTLKNQSKQNQLWFNFRCEKIRKKLLSAWHLFRSSPSAASAERYKREKRGYYLALKQARSAFSQKVNTNILTSNSSSDWWSHLRKLQPRSTPRINTMRSANGTIVDDVYQISNILNNHFVSPITAKQVNQPTPLPGVDSIGDPIFRRQTVLSQLRKLPVRKATGPDGIPNIVLKNCALSLAFPLALLFRQSYSCGEFPKSWKIASVTPIHKAGARDEASNYRPISLLPAISKVMESIVNDHLKGKFEERNLLSVKQFGFRSSRSTCDLLAILTQKWSDSLDQQSSTFVVTLDLSKAFDRVWHVGLRHKFPAFGIRDRLSRWLTNYLDSRHQYVVLNGSSSQKLPVTAGVPQGSVLGPTLFLLFINDITTCCRNPMYLFADDCTLFRNIRSDESLESAASELQADLNALAKWTDDWNARFNPAKCEVLLITRKHLTVPPLTLYSQPLPTVDSLKLLGMRIDNTLCFNEHIQTLAVRGSRALGTLCRASRCLNLHTRTVLYKALVRSTLEYGCPIWGGAAQKWLGKLDSIQRRAIRLLRIDQPLKYNIAPLEVRRHTASMLFFRKHLFYPPDPNDQLVRPEAPRDYHCAIRKRTHDYSVSTFRSRTSHHRNSFVPRISRLWNALPAHVAATVREKRFGSVYYNSLLSAL
jgi:hypothetical protein